MITRGDAILIICLAVGFIGFMVILLFEVMQLLIEWWVHLSVVNFNSEKREWWSYRKFKEEFKKHDWGMIDVYPDSLFDLETDSECHRCLITFNDIGVKINNPIGYYRAKKIIEKYIEKELALGCG